MNYETNLRNKDRGYMKLIVWQKSIELFELVWKAGFVTEYLQFLYYALGSLAETMTRAIGLKQTNQISGERFDQLERLHYEVENRLLRLVEKLEQKRDSEEWITRIKEYPEEFGISPTLQHLSTPAV